MNTYIQNVHNSAPRLELRKLLITTTKYKADSLYVRDIFTSDRVIIPLTALHLYPSIWRLLTKDVRAWLPNAPYINFILRDWDM